MKNRDFWAPTITWPALARKVAIYGRIRINFPRLDFSVDFIIIFTRKHLGPDPALTYVFFLSCSNTLKLFEIP